MAPIPQNAVVAAYDAARKVFDGHLKRSNAIRNLTSQFDLKESVASDLINNYRAMREGKLYARTNNLFTTRVFLEGIYRDSGAAGLEKAVAALSKHLEYYRGKKSDLPSQRLLLKEFQIIATKAYSQTLPEEVAGDEVYIEGAVTTVSINQYERDPNARRRCVEHYGVICSVCDFDFERVYGEIGKDFIHVHHLVELASIAKSYVVDPIKDLRPVCPNCHAMIHRRRPGFSIEEVKAFIADVFP